MHSVSDGAFSKEEYCDHVGFLRELNDKMWLVNVVVSNLHAFHIDQRGGHKPALQAYCTHKEIALMMQASKTAQIVEKLAIPVGPEDVATRESVVALFERNKLLFSFQLL
ncbi:hypothetical protein Pelo_19574 [Pelomyxa schiedti]|nr:hypothetical protein Pelo_19574 [Pelomyxa schiedti]